MDKDKKYCINCGKEIPKTATFCPYCSAWQEDSLPKPAGDSEGEPSENGYKSAEGDSLEGTYTLNKKAKVANVSLTGGKVSEGAISGQDTDEEPSEDIKDLMEKAYRDELTHLYNRQKLKEDQAKIKDTDICAVICIDINNLKYTNDTFGHEKGDELINNMATVLRRLAPDQSYRTGGDEFLVLQRGGTEDSAVRLEQNITALLDEMRQNPDNGFVPVAAMGAAEKKSGTSLKQAMEVADKLMYENKAKLKAVTGDSRTGMKFGGQSPATAAAKNDSDKERKEDTWSQPSDARYRANAIRRAQDKEAERQAKELYYARKSTYAKMVAGRIVESIFLGGLLILIILAKMRIG